VHVSGVVAVVVVMIADIVTAMVGGDDRDGGRDHGNHDRHKIVAGRGRGEGRVLAEGNRSDSLA
jgi:hypothetical protein